MNKAEINLIADTQYNSVMNFVLMGENGADHIPFVYAHNMAEDLCDSKQKPNGDFVAPDLVSLSQGVLPAEEGAYACTVYNEPATFFFWKGGSVNRGLIVLNNDPEGAAFAKKKFEARAAHL